MKIVVAMDSYKGCLSSREAGEGRLDAQTAMGKAPAAVAALAHAHGLPAIALVAAFVIFWLAAFLLHHYDWTLNNRTRNYGGRSLRWAPLFCGKLPLVIIQEGVDQSRPPLKYVSANTYPNY